VSLAKVAMSMCRILKRLTSSSAAEILVSCSNQALWHCYFYSCLKGEVSTCMGTGMPDTRVEISNKKSCLYIHSPCEIEGEV
jgi:hypothetical protein